MLIGKFLYSIHRSIFISELCTFVSNETYKKYVSDDKMSIFSVVKNALLSNFMSDDFLYVFLCLYNNKNDKISYEHIHTGKMWVHC